MLHGCVGGGTTQVLCELSLKSKAKTWNSEVKESENARVWVCSMKREIKGTGSPKQIHDAIREHSAPLSNP
jgi:hypothetical protein